ARAPAAIAGYDQGVIELAAQTLGQRPENATDAAAALAAARSSAEGAALGARLSFAAAAVDAVPGSRLEQARLLPDGGLLLTLGGAAEAVNQLSARLASGPFEGKGDGTAFTLADRRAGTAASRTQLSTAMLRFVSARQDAAIVQIRKNIAPLPASAVRQAFVAAGFTDVAMAPGAGHISFHLPAARGTALLPLIADLEMKGARFDGASLSRNADSTLKAELALKS
ncbi:hypothetical protein L6Q21_17275, partial [Sandaracinobacter sp. RS1-74]|uniref:hypothetical protein n=1 Tax=Sandaracinobacteroides sayramensis TaxID=2913411 RepID=UPI001EDC47C3